AARRVRNASLAAFEHRAFPIARLLERLRDAGVSHAASVLNVNFYYQNWLADDDGRAPHATLRARPAKGAVQRGAFELSLEVVENADPADLYFKFDPDVYAAAAIARMAGHYLEVLRAAVAEPAVTVARVPILTSGERQQLDQWNHSPDAIAPPDAR